jgi:hypothetical protein
MRATVEHVDPGDATGIESQNLGTSLPWLALTVLVHFVLPLALALLAWSRSRAARYQEQLAEAQWVPEIPLREGDAVLHGPVDYAREATAALRVEIRQEGTETKNKNKWSHAWSEAARTVVASPFYVGDVRGTRVRVEPDDRTMLVDATDRTVDVGPTTRIRIAELSRDEKVYVVGELHPAPDPEAAGGYREVGTALVLRPPRRGRMLVSTEPLGQRFQRMAEREMRAARWFVLAIAALGMIDAPFYGRLFGGIHETGTIAVTHIISGKGAHCRLTVDTNEEWTFTDDVAYRWCRVVGRGARVPFIRIRGTHSFVQVGTEPGVSAMASIFGAVAIGLMALIYRGRTRPWYEDRLVERGTGRLRPS